MRRAPGLPDGRREAVHDVEPREPLVGAVDLGKHHDPRVVGFPGGDREGEGGVGPDDEHADGAEVAEVLRGEGGRGRRRWASGRRRRGEGASEGGGGPVGRRTPMRVVLPQARAPRVTTMASHVWSQSSPAENEGGRGVSGENVDVDARDA